jgi:hypothetical protein
MRFRDNPTRAKYWRGPSNSAFSWREKRLTFTISPLRTGRMTAAFAPPGKPSRRSHPRQADWNPAAPSALMDFIWDEGELKWVQG